MARGPRKSIEEKVSAKQELIASLQTRIESEKRELEAMLQEKRMKDLESVSELIDESGLSPEEAAEALQRYINEKTAEIS